MGNLAQGAKGLLKAIPYWLFTIAAFVYTCAAYPFHYLFYTRILFPRGSCTAFFPAGFPLRTYLFRVYFGGRFLLVKKKNPVWRLYNRLFLSERPLPAREIEGMLERLAQSAPIKEIVPRLVRVKGRLFVEMLDDEYRSLAALLKEDMLTETEKRGVAAALSEAITRLHESGYSHGDLKPKNILVRTRDLSLKIVDFERINCVPVNEERDRQLLQACESMLLSADEHKSAS